MDFELNCDKVNDTMLTSIVVNAINNNTVSHHTESFDIFLTEGINQILTQLFKIEVNIENLRNTTPEDKKIDTIHVTGTFSNVYYKKPEYILKYRNKGMLYPNQARRNRLTYSATVFVDLTLKATAFLKDSNETIVKEETLKNHKIASIPIMVGSMLCHTYQETNAIKEYIQEDPRDNGGYFIIKGNEWVISGLENRTFVEKHAYKNVGHKNELSRLEFISKPGDGFENSSSITLTYVNNGNIYINFTSYSYLTLDIPFHIIMKLLGMTTDQEIMDHIVYGSEVKNDFVTNNIFNIVKKSLEVEDVLFENTYNMDDFEELKIHFVKKIATFFKHKTYKKIPQYDMLYDQKLYDRLMISIMDSFDNWLLPHLGIDKNDRYVKLRYLGHLIRHLLLVHLDIIPPTDRDDLSNKRIHTVGPSLTKSFKRDFNLTVIKPTKEMLINAFKNATFSNVSLTGTAKKAIDISSLEKALVQSITTGDKQMKIKNKTVPNRIASESPLRKNEMAMIAALRTIKTASTTSANSTIRGVEMRRVHPSYIGYICPVQSAPTGDSVGLIKQMAMSCFISNSSSSELLKNFIKNDPNIILIKNILPNDISKYNISKIFVNGDWIAGTANIALIYYRYKDLKKGISWNKFNDVKIEKTLPKIDPNTTIYWDIEASELHFWVDFGRPYKLLPVIRSNSDSDPYGRQYFKSKNIKSFDNTNNTKFYQDILLTKEHINKLNNKEITVQDLINEGVVECITPQECKNLVISPNMDILYKNRNNPLKRYTHVEICQCLLGLPAIGCCFANRSQITRVVYNSGQGKQALGIPVLSWPYRVDKHLVIQYYVEFPICKTIAQTFTMPNGVNSIVAIMSHKGYNQEDSLYFNKASAQRGYTKCLSFDFVKTELDNNEIFTDEIPANTIGIKNKLSRAHLHNGFPRPNTTIKPGEILIGKIKKYKKNTNYCVKEVVEDNSIIYRGKEDITIFGTPIRSEDQDGKNIAILKYYSVRELTIGDKFCLTPDAEVYTLNGFKNITTLLETDLVLSLDNSNKTTSFQKINKFYKFKINEDIYEDDFIKCTLNHKMYYCNDKHNFKLNTVNNLPDNYYVTNYNKCEIENNNANTLIENLINLCYDIYHLNITNDDIIKIKFNYLSLDKIISIILMYGYCFKIIKINEDISEVFLNIYLNRLSIEPKYKKKYNYKGNVYCINVDNHIFLMRKNKFSTPIWTGNSSRHGQKGVNGMGICQSDMPFTMDGIIPDIVLNPHALPSRMTNGQLIEGHLSKLSVIKGMISDATIFKKVDIDNIANSLEEMGLDKYCNEIMFDGKTGEWLDTEIFITPCYYQRLKKFVIEESYSTSNSAICLISRQPLDGAANKGGLRLGEMEKDTIITHGSIHFLMGKYLDDSDGTDLFVCKTCGNVSVVNEELGICICKVCNYTKDISDVFKIKSSHANRLFMQELQSMNVGVKLNVKPYEIIENN